MWWVRMSALNSGVDMLVERLMVECTYMDEWWQVPHVTSVKPRFCPVANREVRRRASLEQIRPHGASITNDTLHPERHAAAPAPHSRCPVAVSPELPARA